jgi:hypothetical protein
VYARQKRACNQNETLTLALDRPSNLFLHEFKSERERENKKQARKAYKC